MIEQYNKPDLQFKCNDPEQEMWLKSDLEKTYSYCGLFRNVVWE